MGDNLMFCKSSVLIFSIKTFFYYENEKKPSIYIIISEVFELLASLNLWKKNCIN